MNRRKIAGLAASALLALTLLAAGCGGLADNAPAQVGDVIIDDAKFSAQVASYAGQYGISQETDAQTYASLAADVLESMITTELALQKAAGLDITVTDDDVQTRIDEIVADYYQGDEAALVAELETESMTLDDLGAQVRDFLLVGKVRDEVTKDVPLPTDEEISAEYDANLADYMTAETIEARHILVAVAGDYVRATESTTTEPAAETTTTTEYSDLSWAQALATAAQLRVDLLAGGSWSALAARYSDDAETKNNGGALGVIAQGDLVEAFGEEFSNALFSLQLDEISEPVMTGYGYHIIQLTKVNEPRQQTLEEATAADLSQPSRQARKKSSGRPSSTRPGPRSR